jgi:hypothetical protein
MNTIPPGGPIGPDGGFDIVNEGSVRAPRKRGLCRADLDDIIVWLIFLYQSACTDLRPRFSGGKGRWHEFC